VVGGGAEAGEPGVVAGEDDVASSAGAGGDGGASVSGADYPCGASLPFGPLKRIRVGVEAAKQKAEADSSAALRNDNKKADTTAMDGNKQQLFVDSGVFGFARPGGDGFGDALI
jgi:hypothetical protein